MVNIDFLDAIESFPGMAGVRRRSYELLGPTTGKSIVDVGCGTGVAVSELAASGATAIGIDPSEAAIQAARSRHADLDFRVAGAESLPLPDRSVDGYRAVRVYHAVSNPLRGLAEARRVLRPGGRIVLAVQEFDLSTVDADDLGVTRAVCRVQADRYAGPAAGRAYRALLTDGGIDDIEVEVATGTFTELGPLRSMLSGFAADAVSEGAVDRKAADGWLADLDERSATGRFFAALGIVLASGTS